MYTVLCVYHIGFDMYTVLCVYHVGFDMYTVLCVYHVGFDMYTVLCVYHVGFDMCTVLCVCVYHVGFDMYTVLLATVLCGIGIVALGCFIPQVLVPSHLALHKGIMALRGKGIVPYLGEEVK